MKVSVGSLTAAAIILFVIVVFSSCIDQKKATYFNNLPDSAVVPLQVLQPPQPVLQINDIIDVKLGGENEKTVQYITQYVGGAGLQSLIDVQGNAELPKIGKIHVDGLTLQQAEDTITAAYAVYLKDPIVTVSVSNFKFAVLGEVRAPGYYNVTSQKINLFEAIAQAGDMTIYSKRDNVKIIRESNGKREVLTVNFNDKNILNSPYYYINRYDIIYVQSQNIKLSTENFTRTASIITTLAGLITIVLVLFKR